MDLDPVCLEKLDPDLVCPERLDPNLVCPERLDPDPVCPERLDPDPVNIRPDPKPCFHVQHPNKMPYETCVNKYSENRLSFSELL